MSRGIQCTEVHSVVVSTQVVDTIDLLNRSGYDVRLQTNRPVDYDFCSLVQSVHVCLSDGGMDFAVTNTRRAQEPKQTKNRGPVKPKALPRPVPRPVPAPAPAWLALRKNPACVALDKSVKEGKGSCQKGRGRFCNARHNCYAKAACKLCEP